jgi:ribulose-5-phosphate 4-epimerase/fuculose-1-phosphate aldolase
MNKPRRPRSRALRDTELRRGVIDTALAMSREGLSPGRSGNVSARVRGGMLITPTGVPYESLDEADIVFMSDSGESPAGALAPSSEWQLHLAVYIAKAEAAAIVHCHSTNATALACAQKPIPPFHYMVAVAGGTDIPLARYATFGTPELAEAVTDALSGRKAALLAHHGQIATGGTLTAALDLAREVEVLATQYLRVLTIGGGPLLSGEEMARVLEKFGSYGQQPG